MLHHFQKNHLLASLSNEVMARLAQHLTLVDLSSGSILYDPGETINYVHFPTSCIVALLNIMENGDSSEISLVGNDGLIGVSLFMSGSSTPSQAVVQSAGKAYQLSKKHMHEEFDLHGELLHVFLSYTQALITQMAQTAVCNRHHTIDQQLCRWLLLSLDRLSSNKLKMTQELIANMLGVRREGITEAAGKLQKKGVIQYCRGQITVIDRYQLEALSCECYSVVKKEADRLLPRSSLSYMKPEITIKQNQL